MKVLLLLATLSVVAADYVSESNQKSAAAMHYDYLYPPPPTHYPPKTTPKPNTKPNKYKRKKPTKQYTKKPTKKRMKKPTKKRMKKPTKKRMKKPTKKRMKKPTKKLMKKPTKKRMKKLTKEPVDLSLKRMIFEARSGETEDIMSYVMSLLPPPQQSAADDPPPSDTSKVINLLQVFDGFEQDDNLLILDNGFAPADANGDVGIYHYVQMGNILTSIFKKSGELILGPFPNNVFWKALGEDSACATFNDGDPIVLYDEEEDRWLVSQFAISGPGEFLCVAISKTGDPTGEYHAHEFDFTTIGLPDYPKYGFVTNAISVMFNVFGPQGFLGTGLGVIDKAAAMKGEKTTMVFYVLPAIVFGFGFLPGDNDGPVFSDMPPTFFVTNNGNDRIDVFEIAPDFDTIENTKIAMVAKIPVTPFVSDLCNAFRERCIDQPGSGTENIPFLEAITDRLMHRLQLRDFGGHKKAVVSHTINADGNGKAGIRWYEFENDRNEGWKLKSEETFSPDGDHRWMPSIAMNKKGETCLGYSISSNTTYPSIGVVGQRGTSGNEDSGELVAFDGNVDANVQTFTSRWGDYSAMAIDPVDDTCWYTTQFAKPNSLVGERFGWATKIVQFEFKGGDY